jgi:hypothetical protein
VIVSVFVRRLKEGRTFADFVDAWEAERGFGVPTRVFNAQSLDDPRDVLSIGFVAMSADELGDALSSVAAQEQVRHDRIADVVESTTLRGMYDLRTEHDFTSVPEKIEPGSAESLLAQFEA